MKKYIFVLGWFYLLMAGVSAQANLSVQNGYGSGKYKGSAPMVHIWAEANPPNMVFDKWVGDTHLLVDPNSWHSRLNLKQKNISLTATYKNAPAWTPVYETINGRQYGFYFPPNIRGLVFRFHGTGGAASTFFNKVEDRIQANDLVAADFAVVALDSDNRTDKQWSVLNPPNNVDINNVQAIINRFVSRGSITANTPIFSVGMSNGGGFSPRVAYALQFKAAAVYCAPGTAYINLTNIPTVWNMAQNDGNENVGGAGNATASSNWQILSNRGIAAQFNLHIASPVYPQRFARIPGLTLNDSQTIYNSLKNNGFLDRANYLSQNPGTSGWQNFIPPIYTSFGDEINDQLQSCYAEHKFYSDYNSRVIAFFNARL